MTGKAQLKMAEHIGKRFVKLRHTRGWSLRAMARISGLSHALLCKVESGQTNPSSYSLWKISQVFKVPVDSWFEGFEE